LSKEKPALAQQAQGSYHNIGFDIDSYFDGKCQLSVPPLAADRASLIEKETFYARSRAEKQRSKKS
jgi:hypothetical protein